MALYEPGSSPPPLLLPARTPPAQLARRAARVMRRRPRGARDPIKRNLADLRAWHPAAAEAFGEPALRAAAAPRPPRAGGCRWCEAGRLAAAAGQPGPPLEDPAHRELLGPPCEAHRWALCGRVVRRSSSRRPEPARAAPRPAGSATSPAGPGPGPGPAAAPGPAGPGPARPRAHARAQARPAAAAAGGLRGGPKPGTPGPGGALRASSGGARSAHPGPGPAGPGPGLRSGEEVERALPGYLRRALARARRAP